ncbi:MAG: type IV toxin-antitoxin system AbiEi family antitoxin domain-containing protein [Oscillospiraceae bacterium]|nr:type IV toxin-antitoxin system AbiEi family antitoxin domain-containing protein [Oscillospiraceae bacterium]
MSLPNELSLLLSERGGVFTTAQANSAGVSNERLCLLVKAGELDRVSFGVYAAPDDFADRMYAIQLRKPKVIYSHDTAFFLHDLTDRDPIKYSVTVPTGYNATRLREDNLVVFTIKRELHELGVMQLSSMFGNNIHVYTMERTICDCLRSRSLMDIAIVTDAVKRYAKRKERNLNVLMQMAETFKVTKLLRNYMEVLL